MQKDVKKPRVGVVAVQGNFEAHRAAVAEAGGEAVLVRSPDEVGQVDALILPGGESTTIGKLLHRFGTDEAIRTAAQSGKPVFGTCAGMILLAERIAAGEKIGGQPTLGLMDISVVRNAWGRQTDSFETDLEAPEVAEGEPIRAVFIRAPGVSEVGPNVDVLARYNNEPVLVRQNNLLACAFHPELTGDVRVHRYFLQMIPRPLTDDNDDTKG